MSRILPAVAATLFLAISTQSANAAQCGKASWYNMGTVTANGEAMDASGMTAAHRSLPFGTRVRVENLANNRSVVVRINDRGPFIKGRIIDVTEGAAKRLGMISSGVARVRVDVLDENSEVSTSKNCS